MGGEQLQVNEYRMYINNIKSKIYLPATFKPEYVIQWRAVHFASRPSMVGTCKKKLKNLNSI